MWWNFIIGFILGEFCGVFVVALLLAGSDKNDDR